jgi:hypothetical protein
VAEVASIKVSDIETFKTDVHALMSLAASSAICRSRAAGAASGASIQVRASFIKTRHFLVEHNTA